MHTVLLPCLATLDLMYTVVTISLCVYYVYTNMMRVFVQVLLTMQHVLQPPVSYMYM